MPLSMSQQQATNVQYRFLSKWQQLVPPSLRSEFIEEFRHAGIAAQVSFRHNQLGGSFVDNTGDSFLQGCIDTLVAKA